MSSKESSKVASIKRTQKILRAIILSIVFAWFIGIPLVGFSFGVLASHSMVINILILLGFFSAFSMVLAIVLLAVIGAQPTVPEIIMKNRNYVGSLKDSKLYLRSQIFNSALAYRYEVMTKVSSSTKYDMVTMLIDQGPGSRSSRSVSPAWLLYDIASYVNKNRQARRRSVAVLSDCYTVAEIRLNRPVPRLIFDSKKARGRQFKRIYAASQQLPFDAAMEEVFTAYAPQRYEIEALSFITPEVSLAMLEMADCDIEFVGNSLICYGQLLSSDELAAFKAKCLNLHKKVNSNLIPVSRKAVKIDPWGYRLLGSPSVYRPALISGGIVVLILSAHVFVNQRVSVVHLLYFVLALISISVTVWKMYAKSRQNRLIRENLRNNPLNR